MDLIKELSVEYFRDRLGSCMFFDDAGVPSYIDTSRSWDRGQVGITNVTGPASKPVTTQKHLPYEFFSSLAVFRVPGLGWRQAAQGRYMVHLSRNNRAYHRAVAPQVLQRHLSPATSLLIETDNLSEEYYTRLTTTVSLVMNPEYTPFATGVQQMRNGEVFSFCTSANLAVIPDVDDKLAIYFNTTRVGSVLPDGSISCQIPTIATLIKEHS